MDVGDCNYMVLDGGTATALIEQGHKQIDEDPLWSSRLLSTDVNSVKKMHKQFLEAGSDIIETNTYQASICGFCKHMGLQENAAKELLAVGVKLARESRDIFWQNNQDSKRRKPLVAGSIGPYGASLGDGSEYNGHYVDAMSLQDLIDWFKPIVQVLVEARVDFLAFDTIPAQKEATAIAQMLREFPDVKAWLSFSCKDGLHTNHGETLASAVASIVSSDQIIATGVNCTAPEHIASLLTSIKPVCDGKKLLVFPNSGEMWDGKNKRWYGGSDVQPIYRYVNTWIDSGASWIGGCCRVFPSDIRNIRNIVEKYNRTDRETMK